jgi:steroid delta-isomerase-like uncharacterized protein
MPDDIKARQREFVERIQDQGDIDAVDDFLAEDFVDHTPPPGMGDDREAVKQLFHAIRAGFPDHDAEVIEIAADGDLVATYKTFTGTHEGDFLGIPATGRKATIRVMDFVRFRDGKVSEHWNVVDMAGLMAQLGVG